MIEVKFDTESKNRIKGILDKMDAEKQDNAIQKGILDVSIMMQNVLAANVSGVVLKVRTGNLYRSLGMRVEYVNGAWTGIVGSGAMVAHPQVIQGGLNEQSNKSIRMVYANILETGGTIRPTGGRRFLTIPVGEALTPAGVPRFNAQQAKQVYEKTVVIFPFIFGIDSNKKKHLLFKLQASVTIPPKRYLSRSVDDGADRVGQVMVDRLEKELKK